MLFVACYLILEVYQGGHWRLMEARNLNNESGEMDDDPSAEMSHLH